MGFSELLHSLYIARFMGCCTVSDLCLTMRAFLKWTDQDDRPAHTRSTNTYTYERAYNMYPTDFCECCNAERREAGTPITCGRTIVRPYWAQESPPKRDV